MPDRLVCPITAFPNLPWFYHHTFRGLTASLVLHDKILGREGVGTLSALLSVHLGWAGGVTPQVLRCLPTRAARRCDGTLRHRGSHAYARVRTLYARLPICWVGCGATHAPSRTHTAPLHFSAALRRLHGSCARLPPSVLPHRLPAYWFCRLWNAVTGSGCLV